MQCIDLVAGWMPAVKADFPRVSPNGWTRGARSPLGAAPVEKIARNCGADRMVRGIQRFGRFELNQEERRLLADGKTVGLGSRAFDVLSMLVESGGALLTKAMILDRVWPDVAVEENNLQVQVSNLRRVLGRDRGWILTIPGRGYRFTAPVVAGQQPCNHVAARPLSVLVLPFTARGSDPSIDWFVDGITDSLTTDLARSVPGCTVVAHATAAHYKSEPVDVRKIGQEQKVRFVLEGTVLLAERHVRVNARLVEAESGTNIWAERFDRARGDVLQLQDEIVVCLCRMAGLQMIVAEAQRAERLENDEPNTCDPTALVIRGMAAARRANTKDKLEAACALYARALTLDPDNVDALVGTASLRVYSVVNGFLEEGHTVRDEARRNTSLAEAQEKLTRALTLAPDYDPALKIQAVLWRALGRFNEALAANAVALARDPGDVPSHRESGLNLMYLGRTEEGCQWFRRADALAPADTMRWTWLQGLGRALIMLGKDSEAVEVLHLAVESNPRNPAVHVWLAAALALSGDMDQARSAFERISTGKS